MEAIMADDRFKILEERLTRMEAALAQRPAVGGTVSGGGFTPPGGVIVDPAPWGGGWVRPRFNPVVDPGPWPGPVVDPLPWPNPVVDPAPWGGGVFSQGSLAATLGRIGHVGDPAPPDFSRLSVSQLESSLHSINAERARLDSMEAMIKKQIETAKQQKG
jgi:hypothetical protein